MRCSPSSVEQHYNLLPISITLHILFGFIADAAACIRVIVGLSWSRVGRHYQL